MIIEAAVDFCERAVGYSLRLLHTREEVYATWPLSPFAFSMQPVASITSIKYYAPDGTDTVVSASDYRLTTTSGTSSVVEFIATFSRPSLEARLDAVRITYGAGHAALTDIPAAAVHAIKLMISALWGDDSPDSLEYAKRSAHDLLSTVSWGAYR